MKPIHFAIALTVVLASITVPALQARADEEVKLPAPAWEKGRLDGKACAAAGPTNCKFKNLHDLSSYPPETDLTPLAVENSDYIAGFIVGKSEANNGK
jgi:hypothetical protein